MSSPDPAIPAEGALWQLLKAYAGEDWDRRAAPWPAPADAFLAAASPAEAEALRRELQRMAALDDAGWRTALAGAHVDPAGLTPADDLARWAADLRRRAAAAAAG